MTRWSPDGCARPASTPRSWASRSTAWSSDIATGNFQLTAHWSQTSVSPYQLYNDWLNSAQATSNAAGDYERLKDPTVDADLSKLASDNTDAAQQTDLAPIEQYVATQPADHPDGLRRRIRRVQHEQVHRLADGEQPV